MNKILYSSEWDYWNKLDFSNLSIEQMHYYAKAFHEIIKWQSYVVMGNSSYIPNYGLFSCQSYSAASYIRFTSFSLDRIKKKLDFKLDFVSDKYVCGISNYGVYSYSSSIKIAIMLLNEACGLKELNMEDALQDVDQESFAVAVNGIEQSLLDRVHVLKKMNDYLENFDVFSDMRNNFAGYSNEQMDSAKNLDLTLETILEGILMVSHFLRYTEAYKYYRIDEKELEWLPHKEFENLDPTRKFLRRKYVEIAIPEWRDPSSSMNLTKGIKDQIGLVKRTWSNLKREEK